MLFCNVDTIYNTMVYYRKEVIDLSKWDKLLRKIISLSKGLRFKELRKVLEAYGYEIDTPSGSSHRTFRKKGCMPITIPEDDPIDIPYVQMVRDVIESEVGKKQ
jgi:predicted RNA binding protein YcfA (HicA-like mRNA interferase family)